jgi:hypothetical protein
MFFMVSLLNVRPDKLSGGVLSFVQKNYNLWELLFFWSGLWWLRSLPPTLTPPTVNFFEKLSTPLWITKPNFPRGFRRVVNLSGNLWFADGFVTANRRLPFIGNKARASH